MVTTKAGVSDHSSPGWVGFTAENSPDDGVLQPRPLLDSSGDHCNPRPLQARPSTLPVGVKSGDSRGLGVEQGGLSPSPQGECDITTLSRGQKGQRSSVQAARARPLPGMPGTRCGVCKADEATVLETATGAPGGHRGTWGKGQLPLPHHLWVLSRGGGAASGHRRAGSSEAHTLAHMCACVHTHTHTGPCSGEPDSLVDPGRWGDRGPVDPERRRQRAALVKQVPRKATQRVGSPRRAAKVFLFAKPVDLPQGPGSLSHWVPSVGWGRHQEEPRKAAGGTEALSVLSCQHFRSLHPAAHQVTPTPKCSRSHGGRKGSLSPCLASPPQSSSLPHQLLPLPIPSHK